MRGWWNSLQGWRTVVFNVLSLALMAIVEIIGWLAGFGGWEALFDFKTAAIIMIVLNVANILLRLITTTAVGQKEQP